MTINSWLTLITIFTLAVISPGPDFIIILRTAIKHGGKTARFIAIGTTLGTCIWIIATLSGITAFLHAYPTSVNTLYTLGAICIISYGIYIIYQLYKTKQILKTTKQQTKIEQDLYSSVSSKTGFSAFSLGIFTTTVANPKALIFYTIIFSSILPDHLVWQEFITIILLLPAITFGWFTLVSYVATYHKLVLFYQKKGWLLDVIIAFLFIGLGIRLFFN